MGNFFGNLVSNSIKLFFGIIIAFVLVVLWQNFGTLTHPTNFSLFVYSLEYPLWIILAITFVGGATSWFLYSYKTNFEIKKELRHNRKEFKAMKQELDKMRNQILADVPDEPARVENKESTEGNG